ncbi:hypothetical protein B0J17DRAFT_372762 [Rhizoctonia solani]|nr:hypothetical protein B0J17DRAFT_372762 [Rhizoctonia solani]
MTGYLHPSIRLSTVSIVFSLFKMFFPVATLLLTALSASATIIAPPTIPRAMGEVIILQPPQGYVVRAGEAFALHYINKPSDSFVTYETEVGLQRAGRHNIRGIKQFHPITDVIKESITIPKQTQPGRYNLIITDHRTRSTVTSLRIRLCLRTATRLEHQHHCCSCRSLPRRFPPCQGALSGFKQGVSFMGYLLLD